MRKNAVVGALVVFVLAAGWLTRWQTATRPFAEQQVVMRVQRYTGEVQILTHEGWRPVRGTAPGASAAVTTSLRDCTPEERRKAVADVFMAIALGCTESPTPTR